MLTTYEAVLLLCLVAYSVAFELHESSNDVQTNRGIGLEEIALFVIGLGVASALGLAIVVGPLFAMFYTSLPYGGINGGNTATTTVGGSRVLEGKAIRKHLVDKLTEGLNILDEALKKYHKM